MSMIDDLTAEERETLTTVLREWRDAGVTDPTLPLWMDADGDGVPDYVGLDANGGLVLVSGATLESSVYESTGDDA